MRPGTNGILETCLYVEDVRRSVDFYEQIFGFPKVGDLGQSGCAMRAGAQQLLLLFRKGASRGMKSQHDGNGELHLAFAIADSEYVAWKSWLEENSIAIEEETTWERGGRSIYFRDPDRHLIEVATPGTWPVY
jgi:catechol 2,3-dioxygenase-like lactoylglutathione lyase family enzyme